MTAMDPDKLEVLAKLLDGDDDELAEEVRQRARDIRRRLITSGADLGEWDDDQTTG